MSVAVSKDSTGLIENPVSGFIGLAWTQLAFSHATPFAEALFSNGLLDQPLMAFQFTRSVAPQHLALISWVNNQYFAGLAKIREPRPTSQEAPSRWVRLLAPSPPPGVN